MDAYYLPGRSFGGGHGGLEELDFSDFHELGRAIEDDEADTVAFFHPLSDDLVPYHAERVISYAGAAGNFVGCPHCGIGGRRVDHRGGYECERCGFSNLQERPIPSGSDSDVDDDDLLAQF